MEDTYSIRPGGLTVKLNPKETALLVVDMQKGFGAPDGSFGRFDPEYPKTVQKPVPTIRKAIDYCHEAGVPVLYSKQTHVPQFFAANLHQFSGRELVAIREAGVRICVQGTPDCDILDELAPAPGDVVLEKNKASFFYKTWLDLYLRYYHTKTVLVTGCNTGYCILHTVYDAFARDFDVIVIEDGVNDPIPKIQETLLEQIDRRFGRVLKWDLVADVISTFPEAYTIDGPRP